MKTEEKTELIIQTVAPVVAGNFDIIKMDLEQTLESYNLILTRDTVKDGKTAAAHLNKMKAAIKLKEKSALEQIMSPVDGFREKVKELVTLVDETRDKITAQVKIYEDKTKEEIRAQLQDYREKRLDSEGLYEPYRMIEIEDLVLLGNQTKTGNLTGKTMEAINGRVAENKAAQLDAEAKEAERKAAEEARIAAEVERRAELNRQEEERKAKERADAEIKRREEEIKAKEREDIAERAAEATSAAASRPVVPYTPEQIEGHKSQAEHLKDTAIPLGAILDTPEVRKVAQGQINREIEDHENPRAEIERYDTDEMPPHNTTTGEIHQIKPVSVYFEIKIDTQGAAAPEVAKFTREWIASISPELGGEVKRIGVTQADGTVSWN